MKVLPLLGLASLTAFYSCEQRACMSPPPTYQFAFVNKQGSAALDSTRAMQVRLTYKDAWGMEQTVAPEDFKVIASKPYGVVFESSYALIENPKPQTRLYTVTLGIESLGRLQLTSKKNTTKCNSWMNLSEARFNEQILSQGEEVNYLIQLP
ncbi:hypothetical protein [Siphonobacter curvatus]|nr:hypothetical protein [Siphonobacter curvatus]